MNIRLIAIIIFTALLSCSCGLIDNPLEGAETLATPANLNLEIFEKDIEERTQEDRNQFLDELEAMTQQRNNEWDRVPDQCVKSENAVGWGFVKGFFYFDEDVIATEYSRGGGAYMIDIKQGDILPVYKDPWGNDIVSNRIYVCQRDYLDQESCGYAPPKGIWCHPKQF